MIENENNVLILSKLSRLLSALYCKSPFADFRRPVVSQYPALTKSYFATISTPMDVGTLLCEVLLALDKDDYSSSFNLMEMCKKLNLIASNSLVFNSGNSTLEAVSLHLHFTSKFLFEELFRIKSETSSIIHDRLHLYGTYTSVVDDNFESYLVRSRVNRLKYLAAESISPKEIKELLMILESSNSDDQRLMASVNESLRMTTSSLDKIDLMTDKIRISEEGRVTSLLPTLSDIMNEYLLEVLGNIDDNEEEVLNELHLWLLNVEEPGSSSSSTAWGRCSSSSRSTRTR